MEEKDFGYEALVWFPLIFCDEGRHVCDRMSYRCHWRRTELIADGLQIWGQIASMEVSAFNFEKAAV